MRWRAIMLIGLICGLRVDTSRAEEPAPAESEPNLDAATLDVKKALTATHDRIRSWSIEYQVAGDKVASYLHRTIAGRYNDICASRNAKAMSTGLDWRAGSIGTAWEADLFQRWVFISRSSCHWGIPGERFYGSGPQSVAAPLPPEIDTEILTGILAWWPFETRPVPMLFEGEPCTIPQIVKSKNYRVTSTREQWNDRQCCVFESIGHDKLWLDRERNCAINAREIYDPASGRLMCRYEHFDHREEIPQVWVAHRILRKTVRPARQSKTTESEVDTVQEHVWTIIDIQLNENTPEEMFAPLPMRPGAVEVQNNGEMKQVLPGGVELLDDLEKWIRNSGRLQISEPINDNRKMRRGMIVAITVALFFCVPAVTTLRKRGKRSTNADDQPFCHRSPGSEAAADVSNETISARQ